MALPGVGTGDRSQPNLGLTRRDPVTTTARPAVVPVTVPLPLPAESSVERRRSEGGPRYAQATPDLPGSVLSDATVSGPVGTGQTPDARINDAARNFVREMRAGNTRAALDAVHGIRMQDGDANFETRMREAIRLAAGGQNDRSGRTMTRILGPMQRGERAMFDAYLQNPGGRARPENIIYAAVAGTGSNVDIVQGVFRDLRAQYPNDEAGFQRAVEQLDRDYTARYGRQRNVTSMQQDLTEGFGAQFWGDSRVQVRAASVGAEDAFSMYAASEGTMWSTNAATVLGALERNAGGMDQFATNYGFAVDGVRNQGIERVNRTIDAELSPSDRARARLLTDTSVPPDERAVRYLNATFRDYLAGSVTSDGVVRSMRNLMADQQQAAAGSTNPLSTTELSRLDPALVARMRQARDPQVVGMLAQLDRTRGFTGDQALVGDIRQMLRGGREQNAALLSRLYALTPEQRNLVRTQIPDFSSLAQAATTTRTGRATMFDRPMHQRLIDAVNGNRIDAGTLLTEAAAGRIPLNDALGAIQRLGAGRGTFAADYDRTHGAGAFERTLGRMDNADASTVRMALGRLGGADQRSVETMTNQLRAAFNAHRGNDGWQGLSTWANNQFGFSGPIVDDAMREVVRAGRALGNPPTQDQVVSILRAHNRLRTTMMNYNQEGRDMADRIALAAAVVTMVATGGIGIAGAAGVGAGLTMTQVAAFSAFAGTATVGSHAVFEGNNYTADRAFVDLLLSAGGELGGGALGVAMQGRRVVAPALNAATAGR